MGSAAKKPPLRRYHESLQCLERIRWQEDSQSFIQALHAREVRLLQRLPPAAVADEGALDTILCRGTLLVVYATAHSAIIALGADLSVLKQIRIPKTVIEKVGPRATITSVAFRPADAAVAVAVGGYVITYHGWFDGQDPEKLWTSKSYEAILKFGGPNNSANSVIATLSFSRDSQRLAAVGDGVTVWETAEGFSETGKPEGTIEWKVILTVSGKDSCGKVSYSLGGISPRGNLVAAATKGAEVGRIWHIDSHLRPSKEDVPHIGTRVVSLPTLSEDAVPNRLLTRHTFEEAFSQTDLSFGRSGISSMSWKPRGGGQSALLAVDFDGQMHVFAKVPKAIAGPNWMEEVARTPHVEGAARCAGAFVNWGGGGGAASDENDARGTSAGKSIINAAAPRPSRCYHWVVLVAGTEVKAWRAGGLDDRPKAGFARLEPGAEGEIGRVESKEGAPAEKYHVMTVKSMAPVPLTCITDENSRLVKEYAISNAERRIRSAEPPEPPHVTATFTLAVLNGQAYVSRWDHCPLSLSPALCRAKGGVGHQSTICQIEAIPGAALMATTGVSIVSLGICGEALLWSLNAGSPFAPLTLAGRLKGPHSAVAFASDRIAQMVSPLTTGTDEVGAIIFAVDSAENSLNIYVLNDQLLHMTSEKCFHPIPYPTRITASEGCSFSVRRLVVAPDRDDENLVLVLGFGAAGTADIVAWRVMLKDEITAEKSLLRFEGDSSQPILSSAVSVTVKGESQLVCGGPDGRLRIYTVNNVVDETGEAVVVEDLTAMRCGDTNSVPSPVVEVAATDVASRIAALQEDGTLTIFGLFNETGSGWRREFTRQGLGVRKRDSIGCMSFGTDLKNALYLAVGGEGDQHRGINIFTSDQGLDWKESLNFGASEMTHSVLQPVAFVTPGVLVSCDGASLLAFSSANESAFEAMSTMAIYNPLNILEGMLWIGRPAREVVNLLNALGEQLEYIKKACGDPADKHCHPDAPPLKYYLGLDGDQSEVHFNRLDTVIAWCENGIKSMQNDRRRRQVLRAIAVACAEVGPALSSLDDLGAGFALMATTFLRDTAREGQAALHPATIASALHSSSVDALIDMFVQSPLASSSGGSVSWEYCRNLGVGWWVRTASHVKTLAERIARNLYLKTQDPDSCAMWYIALGKAKALGALYRTKGNTKLFEFMKRNFDLPENRNAAAKNAYVLISKHKLELAAGFFFLAGDFESATRIIRSRMKDNQLALLLARLVDDGSESLVYEVLKVIAKDAASEGCRHEEAMALWLLGQHQEALNAATLASKIPDAPNLPQDLTTESEDSKDDESLELSASLSSLSHVLAIAQRPTMRGEANTSEKIAHCRYRAAAALALEGDPVEALAVTIQLLTGDDSEGLLNIKWVRHLVKHVSRRALTWRAIGHASATSSKDRPDNLATQVLQDVRIISETSVGFDITIQAALDAAQDLSLGQEMDAAVSLGIAAMQMKDGTAGVVDATTSNGTTDFRGVIQRQDSTKKRRKKPQAVFEDVLRKVVVQSLYKTTSVFSHYHTLVEGKGNQGGVRVSGAKNIHRAAKKLETAVSILRKTGGAAAKSFHSFQNDLTSAMYLLSLFSAFLVGDWETMWMILQLAAKSLNENGSNDTSGAPVGSEGLPGDNFAEELRQVADSPLLQTWMMTKTEEAGRTRRMRVSRHFSRFDFGDTLSEKQSVDDNARPHSLVSADEGVKLSHVEEDSQQIRNSKRSTKLIREQALLSAALSSATFASLTSFVAQVASAGAKARNGSARKDISIVIAAERIDALAMDAVYGWYPLVKFGRDSEQREISDEEVRHFAAMWRSLASIPDFAPYLREAATVAAALDTSTAEHSHRSVRDSEYLYNPFPVRFSAAATGPWSGRGKFSVLYREDGALIRSLCVACTDPPVIALCTPRGIQKVIPDSYAANKPSSDDWRTPTTAAVPGGNMHKSNSWSFFESDYEPLILYGDEKPAKKITADSMALSETEASALASHPRRRRFASGGTDGIVRLWNFGEGISNSGLRDRSHGRVVALQYSAYGDALLCVYSSGYVAVWHDPDVYNSHGSGIHEGDSVMINAFGNRRGSEAIFLDERNVVAVVGDPFGAQGGGSTATGHSLRVYDVREASATHRATWTARVHNAGEARCLTLLEDRMRLVTGGCDGSLSVVDARTRTCVAELPAHDDEVICLRIETPRGRALASGCRNGDIKLWDARTLRVLDLIPKAHNPTRQWLTGTGFGGIVGVHGVRDIYLTDRALISCGGDGLVKIWGPGWGDFDHQVL